MRVNPFWPESVVSFSWASFNWGWPGRARPESRIRRGGGLEALIRDRLNDPGSMETIETRIAPADAQGDHLILLDFTAQNAFGGRVRSIAYGWVSQATCEATLVLIE